MKRIQLDLPEAKVKELQEVMERTGIETYKELFNNALTLMKWAIQESERGKVIASLDEQSDSYKQLVMPFLETASQHSKEVSTAR